MRRVSNFVRVVEVWSRTTMHDKRTRSLDEDGSDAEMGEIKGHDGIKRHLTVPMLTVTETTTGEEKVLLNGTVANTVSTFGEVCSIIDSPSRILKVAESGNLRDFESLYYADTNRLKFKDNKGRNALHHAVFKDRVNILEFIIGRGGNINAQDSEGYTALHVAVENEALACLNFLLDNGIDSSILNNEQKGAIHLATELNKVKVLKEIVKHKSKVNTTLRGKHGRTPLHLAAIYDHADCAHILLKEMHCCPKIPCDNGYYAIHEAAKNASANALQAILEWGESQGTKREDMMKLYDADGNVPLHSAVHAGDIKAVKLCLESGAIISTQQHDLSTPVHLACAQGAMEIVKLMFSAQPEEKFHCLTIGDAQQMTPLHCAAMFDHPELVEYLVKEGADLNATDKEGRSVLLLAAARGAWNTVTSLLRLGANIVMRDKCHRNLLHHIVLSGGCLDDFCTVICTKGSEIANLLNERDTCGCTPMHYASRNGHLKTIQSLLRLGAIINLKNNDNQSPLHFAARYGRYNTVRHLLESKKGHLIINEMDGEGMTPLHIASLNGHTRVVHLLLVKGALLHRDHKGRTPLHYAAQNGYTHTMDQLLTVHSHLLDQMDRDGNTALHLASVHNKASAANLLLRLNCKVLRNNQDMTAIDFALHYKHSEVTMAMVTHPTRVDEIMKVSTKIYSCLLEGLTAVMPEVMMAVLDRGITRSKFNEDSKSYYVKYNFMYLEDPEKICPLKSIIKSHNPLPVLNIMVRYSREELLSHPLCVKYLEHKWTAYGMYFHLMNLAIYTVFLTFITANAVSLMHYFPSWKNGTPSAWDSEDPFYNSSGPRESQYETICQITSGVVLCFVALNILKEFYQMFQQRIKYLLDVVNVLEWALYVSAALAALGYFRRDLVSVQKESIYAAIAVFLAWFNYLLYLQRFNRVGIYVVMFLEILSTLLKVMFVFSVLFIAFALSFHILLAKIDFNVYNQKVNEKGFYHPVVSLVRVGTMMLGEMDFLGTFLKPLRTYNPNWLQMAVATCFLVFFIVLMPILLMNLLIGLAVGDIETVRRNAQLKRLTMQVELHTDLERKLPTKFLKMVDKGEIYEYPNRKCTSSYLWTTLTGWFASPESTKKTFTQTLPESIGQHQDEVCDELYHQRKKMKEISKMMDLQLQLLRLIVQKMEIRTENDDMDEGEYERRDQSAVSETKSFSKKLESPKFKRKLRALSNFLGKPEN